jgi:NDP-sugar pyrophosphorylase family protein
VWKDTGQVEDMLEANRLTLDDLAERVKGELVDSRVDGGVAIDSGTRLERATVRGPAVIGAGSVVCDAYVGQFTGIGERVCIERCEIEHSIVLADSTVDGLDGQIEASLLGRDVSVGRSPAASARLPARGRRQRRDRDPVSAGGLKVLAPMRAGCFGGAGRGASGARLPLSGCPAPPRRPRSSCAG